MDLSTGPINTLADAPAGNGGTQNITVFRSQSTTGPITAGQFGPDEVAAYPSTAGVLFAQGNYMSTVLGIDIGTQSVKVILYDITTMQCSASASAPLALHQTNTGVAEQQAQWWTDALKTALQAIAPSLRANVIAIGVSGQQHGFVPIDRKGQPLVPAKLWCDTSTTSQCDYLTTQFGGTQACLRELGNAILPGYTASKLLWFRDTHPDLYAQMDCILLPHDYVNFYLTGEKAMEAGDASGTAFMDIRTRQWSEKMLRIIDPSTDLRDRLPSISTAVAPIGSLLPNIAHELGLPSGIPVAPGGGDNMMSAIGTGNVISGVVTMSLGTSGTIFSYSQTPVIDPQGNIAAFCSSTGGWLPLICTMNCTTAMERMRELFDTDLGSLERNLSAADRGAGGIVTVPFFTGERTPDLPNGKACMFGLDSQNMRQENFLRSAIEGVTFGLRNGLKLLTAQDIPAEKIVLTGGGANSPTWRQMVADICNVPVDILTNAESAALGAALQALASISGTNLQSLTAAHLQTDTAACCEPQQDAVDFYQEHCRTYEHAAAHVEDIYR